MGRTKKIMAGAAIAAASVVAVPTVAQAAEGEGIISFKQEGSLLPVCVHKVRITLFGTTLLDLPEICIG